MNVRIFRSGNGLQEIKSTGANGKFDYEKIIQDMVENNIQIIFPSMVFVKSEHMVARLRIDSVMFDTDKMSFVLFEYKNRKYGGHIEQAAAYYDILEERPEAFLQAYNDIMRKSLKKDDINWDENRVIAISPEFTEHQRRAVNQLKCPIELYTIASFEDGVFALAGLRVSKPKGADGGRTVLPGEYSLDDYMSGRYHMTGSPKDVAKSLFKKTMDAILDRYPDLEYGQKKPYGGFYTKDGSLICCLVIMSESVKIYYVTNRPDVYKDTDGQFVKSRVGDDGEVKTTVGGAGYVSHINNDSDVGMAVNMVQKVYDLKSGNAA